MKNKTVKALMLIPLLNSTEIALADGNRLLDYCQAAVRIMDNPKQHRKIDLMKYGECIGFVSGVKNTLMVMSFQTKTNICWPEEGVSDNQAARITLKYLKENPQDLHEDRTLLVMLSMKEAFPCK